MDWMLPDVSGLELTRLRRDPRANSVIADRARRGRRPRRRSRRRRRRPIVKPFSRRELLARIRAALRRDGRGGEVVNVGQLKLDAAVIG
jgi:DNA-binding response OmpR family regulator